MPKKVIGYECNICGQRYEGPRALERARWCEKRGKPDFSYEVGQEWQLSVGDLRRKFVVAGHFIQLNPSGSTHIPCYLIDVFDDEGNAYDSMRKSEKELERALLAVFSLST